MPGKSSRREVGEVSNWFKQRGYGFVTREGRESSFASDIQLHIANAKGERLKEYVTKHGLILGAKIKYSVDYEENKGKAFAASWELVDAPDFKGSRSRSGEHTGPRTRRSPSYGGNKARKRSPSHGQKAAAAPRRSPSYGRSKASSPARRKASSPARRKARRSRSMKRGGNGPSRGEGKGRSRSARSWSRRRPRSRS